MPDKSPDGRSWGSYYDSKLRSYMERNNHFNDRQEKNWKMFSGVDYGQWDSEQFQQLVDEKRPPHQINFLQHKVNTLLGNFLQNPYEAAFESESGNPNDQAILLNHLRLADANRGKWSKSKRLFYRAGLILRGVMEMYVDYKFDPLGNINWRYWNPFRVQFDPNWDSDDINDNSEILFHTWMDPVEIRRVYNKKSEEIESAIKQWKMNSSNPGYDMDKDELADRSPQFYNNLNGKYLVIQGMRMDYINSEKLYDMDEKRFLPDMSPENKRAILAIRGSSIKSVPDKVAICKLVTVCPGLAYDLTLENGRHPIQIGSYPIWTWSAMNLHGEVQGIVDILKDPQEIYNKRESTFTHWQTTSANGVEFVEEDFFADGQWEEYLASGNIPGSKFIVNPGKLTAERGNGLQIKDRGQPPNDLHISADRALEISNLISATPPAISGGEGKSGESGRLFMAKRNQALVSLEPLSASLQDIEESMLDGYFRAVKQRYRSVPRVISGPGVKPIMLNMPMQGGGIANDIDSIQRQNIVVTQSRKGVSIKREMLNAYTDALQVIRNPLLQSFVEMKLVGSLPNIPDNEIEQAESIAKLFLDVQVGRTEAEKAQIQAALKQFMQGSNNLPPQLGTSPPGKTPVEGGGISPEGKQISPQGGIPADVKAINQLR